MSKVYSILTDKILESINKGVAPWRKPWTGGKIANYSGREYRGINRILLPFMAGLEGYTSGVFLTFNQVKQAGGTVKKGAKSFPVYLWTWLTKTDDNGSENTFPIFRFFNVFAIEQTEGIELPAWAKGSNREVNPIEACDAIVAGYKDSPQVSHGGSVACYFPAKDSINMPAREAFHSCEEYYSTLFHEFAHSTGHSSRLNRKEVMGANYFGSHDYSLEELVAELTACFLCSDAGIEQATIENSAAYLAGWSKALGSDPKMFAMAAARAQKAADYIMGRKDGAESDES